MRARLAGLLGSVLLLASCTGSPEPVPDPSFPAPTPKDAPAAVVSFVGSLEDPADSQYLDAIRLAVSEVNSGPVAIRIELRVHDDLGEVDRAAETVLSSAADSASVLYAGPGTALTRIRPELELTQVPVFLLGGDLYTTRELFSNVFQVSHPLLWQSRVLARYLQVRDAPAALVAARTREAKTAWASASAEEGIGPASSKTAPRVVLGLDAFAGQGTDGPGVALLTDDVAAAEPEGLFPGTVVVGPYAWSGWADPIPRVAEFRAAFEAAYGGLPLGLEQHGYDALHVLAAALADTRGQTGRPLVLRLERVKNRFFSSMAIRLGPDDHTFYDDYTLGVFEVVDEAEADPWTAGGTPWKPVMWSFTNDLERTTIWQRDRGPFFPNWKEPAPSPKYFWSRLGIVDRPSPLRP